MFCYPTTQNITAQFANCLELLPTLPIRVQYINLKKLLLAKCKRATFAFYLYTIVG